MALPVNNAAHQNITTTVVAYSHRGAILLWLIHAPPDSQLRLPAYHTGLDFFDCFAEPSNPDLQYCGKVPAHR
ncbi:hypothetical protein N7523_010052 [Penicillium sp. IBT 18751x]|nr:hypothetical protein N7523_010052 [Penicillium sp. IBT 18751x]